MKYKVGDKVKIREDLVVGNKYGADDFTRGMEEYKGAIVTITDVFPRSNKYRVNVNSDADIHWNWTDEMFEDIEEVDDNEQVRTVDIGFHLDYCGHKVIKNVYYGGYAHDDNHVFCTTADSKNQYTLPLSAIDFIIPHEG